MEFQARGRQYQSVGEIEQSNFDNVKITIYK